MHDIFGTSSPTPSYKLVDFKLGRFVLSPDQWRSCSVAVALNWSIVPFGSGHAQHVPDDSEGVYSFVVKPGIANHPDCSYLLYVGKAERQNFRARYRQYLREKAQGDLSRRPHVTEMLLKWEGHLWFCYAPISTTAAIEQVEDTLLAAYLPPVNKDFPASVRKAIKKIFAH